MNVSKIENKELRYFIEQHPDANFRNIVDFCIQKFDDVVDKLSKENTKRLQNSLDNDNLRETGYKLETIIQPYVKQTANIRYYQNLQDVSINQIKEFISEIDTIGSSHSASFVSSLKDIIHSEFEEIRMIKPNSRTDLDSIYSSSNRRMNIQKDIQDDDDRRIVSNLSSRATDSKKMIHKQFVELSQEDMKTYGIVYEPNRGVSQNRNVVDGIKSKVEQLVAVFNSTSQFFNSDISRALSQDNMIILEGIQGVVKECRNIISEAVYQISKEQKEDLHQEYQRSVSIEEQMTEEQSPERIKVVKEKGEKLQTQTVRTAEDILVDEKELENFENKYDKDKVLIEPSPETYQKLMEAGMPRDVVASYIWDKFVRTINADERLKIGEITQDAYDKELVKIQKIEEILFNELVSGTNFEDARYMAEDIVEHGKEYIAPIKSESKQENENIDFSYDLNNIEISASDETRTALIELGMPEKYVDAFVCDRFVRTTNLDNKLKSGKITQTEYDEKSELIDRIEELLFDELVEGKTVEEARVVAEDRATREANVLVEPSPETLTALEEAGLSSEDAKRYVWDRFTRIQLIDDALENGQITESEKEEQIAKVDKIERAIADGLKGGKSFNEARRDAEISTKKAALQDVIQDKSITMGIVTDAYNFVENAVKTPENDKTPFRNDYII